MKHEGFSALEKQPEIRAAVKDWRDKFSQGAEVFDGFGGQVFWHPQLAIWGHFGGWKYENGSTRHWNPFGSVRENLRKNIIVEINPPGRGINKIMQGVIARDSKGMRWLLHKGRMSIPGAHIKEEQFDEASTKKRVPVRFSDKSVWDCHVVANIDEDPEILQKNIASFINECRRVRLYHTAGADAANQEAAVELAEELTGTYHVPAQGPKVATRLHGDVWHALVSELSLIGAQHTNSRVGRWGPDLRTVGDAPVLFEIKVTVAAADLQQAVGQLLLYERLLEKKHRKVLVFPKGIGGGLATAAQQLGLEILEFEQKAKAVHFNKDRLRDLVS